MTVMETDEGLLVHSPIALAPESLREHGDVRWALAPNKLHHLFVGPWSEAGVETWACKGLPEKRPDVAFKGVIEPEHNPFGNDIKVLPLQSFPFSNEVVVLHRPTRTLVVTDLVFNMPPTSPWSTRAFLRASCGYPGCNTTLLERMLMRRAIARREFEEILSWDFERIVMSHGDVVEEDGKAVLENAFRWLLKR